MADILSQSEQFKSALKNTWLNYYEANRSWLQQYMNDNGNWCDSVYYEYDEDDEYEELESFKEELENLGFDEDYEPRRPECYFIIGVMSVLEPQVQVLLSFTASLTTNSEKIITALGLDFDPEIELKRRSQQLTKQELEKDSQYLDQIREEIKT